MTQPIKWRDLLVTNDEGFTGETLGSIVDSSPANLDGATYDPDTGAIATWDYYFISAEGEEPDWDTPKVPVDWSGFQDALKAVTV